jgi:uncharacterized membrane protein YjgN (DUF898 family)
LESAITGGVQAQRAAGEPMQLSWVKPRGMLGLSVINFVLRLSTLGLYHYWGKTEVRTRIWSGVRINGEPLSYIGTGWQLFAGFAIAMLVMSVPYGTLIGAQMYYGPTSPKAIALSNLFLLAVTWMWSVAAYRARGFRLARSSWRGVNGSLTGSAAAYAWEAMWTSFVVGLSFGWAYPWRQTKLQRKLVQNTRFGDKQLSFTATADGLYGPFSVLWIVGVVGSFSLLAAIGLMVPPAAPGKVATLPVDKWPLALCYIAVYAVLLWLAGAWYQTRCFNHYSAHTSVDGVSFEATAKPGSLMWLMLTNWVIALVPSILMMAVVVAVGIVAGLLPPLSQLATLDSGRGRALLLGGFLCLGLLGPYIQARTANFWIGNLKLKGTFASGPVKRETVNATRRGEGLAQAFDIDVF